MAFYSYVMGIDPGKKGGISVLYSSGDVFFSVPMPETEKDIFEFFCEKIPTNIFCFLEQAQPIVKAGSRAAFNFGLNYGVLRGILIAREIPFETVRPVVWQRFLGCLSGGDKNKTKRKAQELFPSEKGITHTIADSLLIAEYGRRKLLSLKMLSYIP